MECVKSQTSETKQKNKKKKKKVLKIAPVLYDELIKIYKKKYGQIFKSKDKEWKLRHDYKNLKDLDYQPNQPQQSYQSQQSDQL